MESADEAIQLHLKHTNQPVYYYLFGHRGVASFSEVFGDPHQDYGNKIISPQDWELSTRSVIPGVCHADELQYLFPVGDMLFPTKPPDHADKKVAKFLTTLWTNFAKTGYPHYLTYPTMQLLLDLFGTYLMLPKLRR